ncbi:MAG: hypothetical protein Fur0024_1520 [Patescibacteria group bacterium]
MPKTDLISELDIQRNKLRFLKENLASLIVEKSDLDEKVRKINSELFVRFGDLYKKIETLKIEIDYQQRLQKNEKPKEELDEEARKERENLNKEYAEQEKDAKEEKTKQDKLSKLTEEIREKIKSVFKELAKKFHPDLAPEDQKENYTKLMKQINDAYQNTNLEKLLEIQKNPQKFLSEKLDIADSEDLQEIYSEIDEIIKKIEETKTAVETLKSSELYKLYNSVYEVENANPEKDFEIVEKKLQSEIENLEKELKNLKLAKEKEFPKESAENSLPKENKQKKKKKSIFNFFDFLK